MPYPGTVHQRRAWWRSYADGWQFIPAKSVCLISAAPTPPNRRRVRARLRCTSGLWAAVSCQRYEGVVYTTVTRTRMYSKWFLEGVRFKMQIDTEIKMYSDTPPGKDPDSHSPTLRSYHQYLWSKPLPSGRSFDLTTTQPKSYLFHNSALGEWHLSSDSIGHTYSQWKSMAEIIDTIPPTEIGHFFDIASTIGAYIVFPARTINRQQNINMARGTKSKIRDRFDLTLECIKLHYRGEESPLSAVLARYSRFFELFGCFEGYVEFFLLQDLIRKGTTSIDFFLPFHDFGTPAIPRSTDEYNSYRDKVVKFINARNERIRTLYDYPR